MILLAVSSLTFEGFENNQYEKLFEQAHKIGYRRVEFNCWYENSLTPVRIRELKVKCKESGLEPIALHVSGFGCQTSELRALNAAHKIRAIEAARELGVTRVVASAMESCLSKEHILCELDSIEQTAREYGVTICLENHCHGRLAGIQDYQWIMKQIDSPHIAVCLDGGHLEAHGDSIEEFIHIFSQRIKHIHLKENRIFGTKSFCRFGRGTTDNVRMLRLMEEKGYSGFASVELSPEIAKDGDVQPFTTEDIQKPIRMFS